MTVCDHHFQETAALKLRELGISPSPQRVAVFAFLLSHPVHPAAERIYRELKIQLPTISLTTVYNTLKLLCSRGVIRQVAIEDGELRYDGNTALHAHFKCRRCGGIWDIFPESGKEITVKNLKFPAGFQLAEQELFFRGCCAVCSQKEK